MALIVDIFPAREDNYGYLVHDSGTGKTAAIDAPEAAPIRKALTARGWSLDKILITHHHPDHVEAIPELKKAFGCEVVGPRQEADKIKGLDTLVAEGDVVDLGETKFEVIHTPGHTLGHICFYDPAGGHLFSADALFSIGVGRMFEGTPGPMWEGLKKLRALPDKTLIYCGHEYSAANARFALSIDTENAHLQHRAHEITSQIEAGKPTVPSQLGTEKQANPFLRADEPYFAKAFGLDGSDPGAVFGAIRKGKDNF